MFPFFTPLKTPENQRFSGVFRGYKMRTLAKNGLIKSLHTSCKAKTWNSDTLGKKIIKQEMVS